MSLIVSEIAAFVGVCLTGTYIAWSVLERITLVAANEQLTPFSSSTSLGVAIVLIPVFALLRRNHHYLRGTRVNGCKLASVYPHRDPILGLDILRISVKALKEYKLLELWDQLLNTYNGTYWFSSTGKWMLITSEPENFKALLSTRFEDWPMKSLRQQVSILTLGPYAIFAVNGPEWQHARAMIRPSFVRNQIADLECTDRHVENFLSSLPRDGSKFDMDKLLYHFTMDVATDFMFGYSTSILTSPTKEALEFMTAFDYILTTSTNRARLGWLALLKPDRKFDEYVKITQQFVDHHVSQALAQEKMERPYIFMNEIIKSGASHREVRDQLFSLILGGRDTSATTMSSLFWVLARRPDILKKLREEVTELEGRKPTWEELKNLKYLNMVLKETLRLYAAVASNMRTAERDTVLPKGGGPDGQSPLFVPKGTDCRFSTYSLHRRKDYWGDDADEFRPERWETHRPGWEYIPFSGGPRICIGQQFALTQMLYLITRVLQTFNDIQPGDDKPMQHQIGSTISMVNGCWIHLTPVDWDPPFQHQKWRHDRHPEPVAELHRARLPDPSPTARARRLQAIAVAVMIRGLRRVLDPGRDQSLRLVAMAETGVAVVKEAASVVEIVTHPTKALLREPPRLVHPQLTTHLEIVVERLSKNVNEEHLYEIFGQFGHIKDLDLPMNRTSGTNRSTAYILYEHQADAEVAISHMHEAQIDGAIINVSIVLPRRKSPGPPLARRGANIDPRVPFQSSRGGGPPSGPLGGGGGGGRRRFSPSSRYGPRSDVYRPNSLSPARSPGGGPSSRGGGGGGSRYRSRSNGSYSSRSRSRSPAPRRRGGGGGNGAGRYDDRDTRRRSRSRSFDSDRSASRNRGRNYR
ncbi:cytochrome P450 [Trichoderma velutinum]